MVPNRCMIGSTVRSSGPVFEREVFVPGDDRHDPVMRGRTTPRSSLDSTRRRLS